MSLLKRIESARPGTSGAPGAAPPAPGGNLPAPPPGGAPPSLSTAGRLSSQAPVRESFRDVKFRIQNRVIQDLDPKLDLSNREAQVSQDILRLARTVVGERSTKAESDESRKATQKKSLFSFR